MNIHILRKTVSHQGELECSMINGAFNYVWLRVMECLMYRINNGPRGKTSPHILTQNLSSQPFGGEKNTVVRKLKIILLCSKQLISDFCDIPQNHETWFPKNWQTLSRLGWEYNIEKKWINSMTNSPWLNCCHSELKYFLYSPFSFHSTSAQSNHSGTQFYTNHGKCFVLQTSHYHFELLSLSERGFDIKWALNFLSNQKLLTWL